VAWLTLASFTAAHALDGPRRVRGPSDQPVTFRADVLKHDSELGITTAEGNVEAWQDDRILLADKVTYNERTGVVTATGNVVLMEPSGEVAFADYVELRDEFRNGVLTGLKILFKDDSRFAAVSGYRADGNRTVLQRGVYTPCKVCADKPDADPIWQLRAEQIVHDQVRQRIEYRDATFEVFGFPIAYSPYWSHPDPTVKRQSGVLFPDFGRSSRLGYTGEIPLYLVLSDSNDVTLTPLVTTKEGVVMQGEYRQRTENGAFLLNGSITSSEKPDASGARNGDKDLRGHIYGIGRFNIDETWRWGFEVFRATDDTYLRFYRLNKLDTLTSNVFVEGIRGRGFAAVDAYSFQGLLPTDRNGLTPIVLPLIQHYWAGDVNSWGGYFSADTNAFSIVRTDGVDTRRASTILGYTNPVITDGGHVFTVSTQLRADGYWINEGTDPTGGGRVTGDALAHRVKPLAALEWRYPLIAPLGTARTIVEPIVSGVATPYGGNPSNITNEDSRNFEFDDTNLFSINRFPGRDRYEGGPRINYGLRGAIHGLSGGFSEVMVGQSWRIDPDSSIPNDTGLDKEHSDYVGRVVIAPSSLLDFTHRFRLDRDTLEYRRAEVSAGFGPPWARFRVGYVNLRREDPTTVFGNREEITGSTTTQITKHISLYSGIRYDIEVERMVSGVLGFRYIDECLVIDAHVEQTNSRDRDIKPSTSFNIRIRLLNFG
jgi:LPS-assembly protein